MSIRIYRAASAEITYGILLIQGQIFNFHFSNRHLRKVCKNRIELAYVLLATMLTFFDSKGQ